ncbi:MAG TPA: hypothetical protein VIC57_17225 [Candidatus Dormibacteraeota bacterium]|jgi:hypothetical protein
MASTRPEQPPRRYKLTLPAPIADRLDAYALASHQPAARAAAGLMLAALDRIDTPEGAELLEARRQVQELTGRLEALRRQLAERAGAGEVQAPAPRWEWPLDVLLADAEWWDRWLPRLYELLGRRLAPEPPPSRRPYGERGPAPEPMVDERGYADLLGFLFPPVTDPAGPLTWRSPDYPAAAAIADAGASGAEGGPRRSLRAQVWEPVIRHVAEALCALESTGEPGADAYLRLRAEAEITGPWARTLRHLVGEEEPELPRRRLA